MENRDLVWNLSGSYFENVCYFNHLFESQLT